MGDHRAILVEVRAACEACKAYNDQFLAPQPLLENATPSSHGVHFDAAEDAKL